MGFRFFFGGGSVFGRVGVFGVGVRFLGKLEFGRVCGLLGF